MMVLTGPNYGPNGDEELQRGSRRGAADDKSSSCQRLDFCPLPSKQTAGNLDKEREKKKSQRLENLKAESGDDTHSTE